MTAALWTATALGLCAGIIAGAVSAVLTELRYGEMVERCELFGHDMVNAGIEGLIEFHVCLRCGKWSQYER